MRNVRIVILSLIALMGLSAAASWAQPQFGDVRVELERTDRILERAREQCGVSVSNRPSNILREAFNIQTRAWGEYRMGGSHGKPALQYTLKARDIARRALELAEIEVKAHETLRDLLDSTQEMARDALTIVRERGDPQAQKLLDSGLEQLRRSQEFYAGRDYIRAIRFVSTARDLIQRALSRARGDGGDAAGALDAALDRTQSLIEEVKIRLAARPDADAGKLFDEAVRLQRMARDMRTQGRPGAALRMTAQARETALRVLLQINRSPDRDEAQRAIDVVGQLIEDLSPEILGAGSDEARTILDAARTRYQDSIRLLADGKTAQAVDAASIADRLLRRAAEVAGVR